MAGLGGLFRRFEQGVLQSLSLTTSSAASPAFLEDDSRLEKLDTTVKRLEQALSNHLSALRRAGETGLEYVMTIGRSLADAPSAHQGRLDVKPLARMLHAHRAAVVAACDTHQAAGLARMRRLAKDVAALREDVVARKDRALVDFDSYSRKVHAAEGAVAAAQGRKEAAEAADALRRATAKRADAAAVVAAATARIRASLTAVEEAVCSAANDAALAFLAAHATLAAHAAEAAAALTPMYPGSAVHTAEIAGAVSRRAAGIITARSGGGGGRDVGAVAAPATAPSFVAAMRMPFSLLGTTPFAELHAAAAPRGGGTAAVGASADVVFRPPGHAPGPMLAAGGASAAPAAPQAPAQAPAAAEEPPFGETGGSAAASPDGFAVALYDYEPSAGDELRLVVGQRVQVLQNSTEEGGAEWWRVRAVDGSGEGLVPANRCRAT